ncbi:hypothetical protein JCM19037_4683 [Geomicrobium sp. JCM 19037]|nr:hypothetical protein JCM19037_4683 [Geomicrobium sp. JCM 19037]
MTSPRILLVEDDNAIRTMLHKVLQKEGFQDVDGTATQKQALTFATRILMISSFLT